MLGFGEAAVGAAATIGVAAYNTLSGFSARHDNSHDAQAAETRRLIDDFNKLRKIGDIDDEDYALYMERKDIALQSGKAYRDSISDFKSITALNPVKKLKKRTSVRMIKRRVREANQSLQDLYHHSCSGSSDVSSVTAASGSPPESQAIREWADKTTGSSRYATGRIVYNRRSQHIAIEQYTLSFRNHHLIEDAEVSLKYGCRYGLLGENGSGKSTFLQSIADRDIATPPYIHICLVREEADPSVFNAVEFLVASIGCMNLPAPEEKAGRILQGLGFSQAMMKRPTKGLRDGWRKRVALAHALFIKPRLLLLDEPTTYLGASAIVWLEAYLSTYKHTLVIASNSVDFMDNVCTNILDLTSKKLVCYEGNYSTYVKTKGENEISQMKAYHKEQEKLAEIERFIATACTNANFMEQAKAKQQVIDKVKTAGLIGPVKTRDQLRFNFEDAQNLPSPLIIFHNVAFSYSGNKEDYLYQQLSFGVDMNSRVAILGAKGAGKSTLLKLITVALLPSEGIVSKHSSVKVGKYSQRSAERLPRYSTSIDYLRRLRATASDDEELISRLNRFGISREYQNVPIQELSSALRNKLVFARLAMRRRHILLLDEPTNHLDMESVNALTKAVKEFQGGVVIVSNDFSFISQVAEEIWEVTNKGIRNLTKEGITIMDYKKTLVNQIIAQHLDSGEGEISGEVRDGERETYHGIGNHPEVEMEVDSVDDAPHYSMNLGYESDPP